MPDQSELDDRYFIDEHVYNCPFCNRRNVRYTIVNKVRFDWTEDKTCWVYVACCSSCGQRSMHLSYTALDLQDVRSTMSRKDYRFILGEGVLLDPLFFYSVPTSFFVLDSRVPRLLRELLTEAEGCLNSNFLTGGSACVRKVIYELAKRSGASGENYEERIKSLKTKHPKVDAAYFDTLLSIQQMTSTKVHENSYDGWESSHLRVILSALHEVLHEIFVLPALRKDKRAGILALKEKLLGGNTERLRAELDKAEQEND